MEETPNQTIYIKNLNDKINKQDLRTCLYCLFSTYGTVLDVVALKTQKMRGQAHVVFKDVISAGTALKACDGMMFLDKEMRISYARGQSAIIDKLQGTYKGPGTTATTNGEPTGTKRPREESEEEEEE